jgi:hypothetical protein
MRIVSWRVRARPIRSATQPKRIPPVAQPTRSADVTSPVTAVTRAAASGSPGATPRSCGTQTGATKLKSKPSKTSKPQPSQAAKKTVHW